MCWPGRSVEGVLYTGPPRFVQDITLLDAQALAANLIRDHKVAVILGDTFGANDATYLRIDYGALQSDTLLDAIGRLCRGLHAPLPDSDIRQPNGSWSGCVSSDYIRLLPEYSLIQGWSPPNPAKMSCAAPHVGFLSQ